MDTLVLALLPLVAAVGLLTQDSPRGTLTPQEGEITVTILYDNTAARAGLRFGWGFAALLETPHHTILFDTGEDGPALLENFRSLGKDPMAVEAVVISHAHGDHTGGLQALLDLGLRPTLYLLEGFPGELREAAAATVPVVLASAGQEVVPGVRSTGEMGTSIPEQALILDTRSGTVVLTGCAHPGVVEMTERAAELAPGPIHLVAGGFHLSQASEREIREIVDAFRGLGVEKAGPTHCSGDDAIARFREAYGPGFQPMGAGRVLRFPLP